MQKKTVLNRASL